ncbi:BZ3500_MvSof-1268-A1-R1_Chr4-4g07486 [Microbotryum saponariae]|uniref:BZ3500_MvSof-1268-A1-R1_Chr4-4g07486 protein n=1 Tax=Microbotryum saponariae TaxID=289078 RepID=A0A2X0NN11_9BASI|nr:BZ3500_MvSof-1268-A1-R1_Chr4-4g07486 [Microbotryum saponariae]SDA07147.1 BZ3501_MvSof-1269-A2-R1_Chr4-3g07194 [Microbotryum saponariae]
MLPTTTCRCFASTTRRVIVASTSTSSSIQRSGTRATPASSSIAWTLATGGHPSSSRSLTTGRSRSKRMTRSESERATAAEEEQEVEDEGEERSNAETREDSHGDPTAGKYGKIQSQLLHKVCCIGLSTAKPDPLFPRLAAIPFHLPGWKASEYCSVGAHSAFGFGTFLRMTLNRVFGNIFETGVERLAFRGVLLPVWKIDLAIKGTAWLDAQMSMSVSASNATIPGYKMSPLDQLTVDSTWDSEPVPFSPSHHAGRQVVVRDPEDGSVVELRHGEESVPLTVVPFTHHPLNLLRKITGLPRTTESQHGIGLDPSGIKASLFGAYPLYIPVYLAEYAKGDERATTVAFGASEKINFALYASSKPEPRWEPNGDACELTVGGSPLDFTQRPKPNALQVLKPKLDEWFANLQTQTESSSFLLTDPIKPYTWSGAIANHPRVLEYSEHSQASKAYIQKLAELDRVEALMKNFEVMDENVKGLMIGPKGVPKLMGRDGMMEDVKKRLSKAKKEVELAMPRWVRDIDAQTQK